jgi:hypothetical protein
MKPEDPQPAVLPSPRPREASAPPPSAEDPVDTTVAMQALMLIQTLLKGCLRVERAQGAAPAAGPRRKSYTPRSDAPLRRLAAAPVAPARLRWRTLEFACPCCSRQTTVVRRQAGRRLRCPHCNSAVEAPHPRRGRSAHNLQRDIESVLRPESFDRAVRPAPPRIVRTLVREPILILALGSLVPLSFVLLLGLVDVIDQARGGVPNTVAQVSSAPAPRPDTTDSSERAVALVRRFLAAPTAGAKAEHVRDPHRVSPLMYAMAARQPDLFRPVTDAVVRAAGLSHYADPRIGLPVTPVVAEMPDGSSRTYFVEHGPRGDAIEWESSVGYCEPLDVATGRAGLGRAKWRVEATPDDYFNRSFADGGKLICLRLTRAEAPDETVWAYAERNSEVGRALSRLWMEAPGEWVRRLTVSVQADRTTPATRQLRLTELHHAGWRSPDTQPSLVAGNP